jgi:hypothetical protein
MSVPLASAVPPSGHSGNALSVRDLIGGPYLLALFPARQPLTDLVSAFTYPTFSPDVTACASVRMRPPFRFETWAIAHGIGFAVTKLEIEGGCGEPVAVVRDPHRGRVK